MARKQKELAPQSKKQKEPSAKKVSFVEWQLFALKEYIKDFFYSENAPTSVLMFLVSFAFLNIFPFYPLPINVLLCLAVAYLAYSYPTFSTILLMVVALPAAFYQDIALGWLISIIFSFWLIFVWEHHQIIASFMLLLTLPFTPLWPLEFIVMLLFSFQYGSKRSAEAMLLLVFLLFGFSKILGAPSKLIPILDQSFKQKSFAKEVSFEAMINFFTHFAPFSLSLPLNEYITTLAVYPFTQIGFYITAISWAAVAFLAPSLSIMTKSKYRSTFASLAVYILPIVYSFISENPFDSIEFTIYASFAVITIYYLESLNYPISKQVEVIKKDLQKKFMNLGIEDLSLGSKEKLEDIGDYEETKKEIYESIILPIEEKATTGAYNLSPVKGVLLFGPPGTGKTMLMRALANEIKVGLYYVKASNILSPYQGVTEKNITEIFALAKKNAPCILFFDEIDALAPKRESTENEEIRRILSTLLQELDGFTSSTRIIFVGATNAPHLIDPALLRPGRIDKIIYFPLPDFEARKQIFKAHTKNLPLKNVNFDYLAKITERYSGADIANVCKETVRLIATKAAKSKQVYYITTQDFEQVIKSMKPSTTIEQLEMYEDFKKEFERRVLHKEQKEKEAKVTFADVADLEDVKKALRDALELPLLHKDLIQKYNVEPVKGILMFGPPGCGKTFIMKAAANEMNVNFFNISGAQTVKMGKEKSVLIIREIFNRAKENVPSVIFIDEIDALIPRRELASEDMIMVVTEFLTQLDGIKDITDVVLVGATNRPEAIDPAMLRPGRFDRIIFVPLPNREARKQIFAKNLEGMDVIDLDLDMLVDKTVGYTAADIANICREVKLDALTESMKTGQPPVLKITQILNKIEATRPSVTESMMENYLLFLAKYGERK